MRIRDARPEDLDRLLELYGLLEEPYADGRTDNLFTRVLLENQHTLVAEIYNEIAGTLVLALLPNLAQGGAPYAVIEDVVVDREYRGEGVDKALMREALRRARSSGAYKLTLSSNTFREKAREFYRSIGMKEAHVGFEVRP